MSGIKTRHFYNNLLSFDNIRYLEIGCFIGSTVCSAMYNNNAVVFCIDNWSEFGNQKEIFLKNFNTYKGNNKAYYIEEDCFKLDVTKLPKFNVYLYDGNHSKESHYNNLDDIFIYIVDDWNWEEIRIATNNVIKDLNFKILYEKSIITEKGEDSLNWWNGIYIVLLQK